MDRYRFAIVLAIFGITLGLLATTLALWPDHPQHESNYYTQNGFSNLLNDDHTLRACDTWANGWPYTAWSHDLQTGNFAFATDGTGANDGNCTNKQLNRDHDQHGSGTDELDARDDIQRDAYSSHR